MTLWWAPDRWCGGTCPIDRSVLERPRRCIAFDNDVGAEMTIQGKKVLVTGADGFIGSHLTEMLAARGADVRALCLYNSFSDWGWLENVNCLDRIEILTGDVRDPHLAKLATRDCHIVFHLAALIAIPYSYVAPDSYVQTNI